MTNPCFSGWDLIVFGDEPSPLQLSFCIPYTLL